MKTQELLQIGPILVVNGDQFQLIWNKHNLKRLWTLDLRRYHQYKTMAHVPASIYLLKQSPDPVSQLKTLGRLLKKGLKELEDLPPESYQVQSEIAFESFRYLQQEISLEEYMTSMRLCIGANIQAAVSFQLETYQQTMEDVLCSIHDFDPQAILDLRVIVLGPLQARDQNLQLQFFSKYLGIENDRSRLLYAENMDQVASAIDLLGTVVLDRKLSRDLLDQEERRMERDLLGSAAAEHLKHPMPDRSQNLCPYLRRKTQTRSVSEEVRVPRRVAERMSRPLSRHPRTPYLRGRLPKKPGSVTARK
jgi:hypothetical protein